MARRGVRVVYGAALEKRSPRQRSVGSNPTLSARILPYPVIIRL